MNQLFHRRHRLEALGPIALVAFLTGCAGANGVSIAPRSVSAESSTAGPATVQSDNIVKNVLYVSNLLSNVTLFPAGIHKSNPQPLETITDGTTRPEGMWVDRNGTLYGVNGRSHVNVAEYRLGKTSPHRLLEIGLVAPTAVAVGSDGTVYVNDVQQTVTGVVVVYARGQLTPERTITLPDPAYALEPGGLAFDANGDLLVATLAPENNAVHVFSIAPGSSSPVDLGLQGAAGAAIAIDHSGNLYTAGAPNAGGTVAVYAPDTTLPFRNFQLGPQINFITVAADGTLYAGVLDQRTGVTGVAEVAPGSNTITNLIDKGNSAYGVALGTL
jgi:hypothetical protein